ncbi:MAG TPA: hypothetical protein VLG76_02415 [Rhabdochlamydiaceae bacterium]|nr:hypothetical protein [Rhabdochlamydiaceae bacterium]
MSKNPISFTQAAAVGGMAICAQAIIQPTTFLGWTAATALVTIGQKIITKAAEKVKIWHAHKARYLQLGYMQYSRPFQTINQIEDKDVSKREEELLKQSAQLYLKGKIGHLLPADAGQKQDLLDYLSENFFNSTKFDAEFLGVCMGGSMAAAGLFLQSTLQEHPQKLLDQFMNAKKGSVLFHGLHRLTSEEDKKWQRGIDIEFLKKPRASEIFEALIDKKTQILDRAETFSSGLSAFFGREIAVSVESLDHLSLNPIYPWAAKKLQEFMEKQDGKAAVCILEGRGDTQILHIIFKDSYVGHAVVWYADSKTCSYFYLDLNGQFKAVFSTSELAHNVLASVKEKYGSADPSVKEVCLIS